jgi:hypothetical protein
MSSPVCLSAAWFSILLAALFVAAGQAQTRSDGGESVAKRNSGNPFGMQLRPPPVIARAAWAPAVLRAAPTNECSMVARRDGSLEIYSITKPASDSVSVIRSSDGGITWSEPTIAFPLPGRAYYAVMVLEARDGALHAVYHVLGDGPDGYRGRLYEVWHMQRPPGGVGWTESKRIVPGYVGSINGFIQLAASGRLLLAVARAIPERAQRPGAGPDRGWNDTFVYYSDDDGASWRQSPDQLSLELATPNVTRYGAIEPTLLEMRDGRVWMLVRDRGGRLWQSFSPDGGQSWPALERSPFISSDSPADLLRLRNGKILLLTNACQNGSDPRSYAMGGREVLHAAISADEGRTWRGFREILHESGAAGKGDRGTSYASAVENRDGKVVVVSGQGESTRAILMFDPGWLDESGATDDLNLGPVAWSQYGDQGLRVEQLADGTPAVTIPLKSSGICGGLWNFPLADDGGIALRVKVPRDVTGLRFSLNDHFNRIDDASSSGNAVFSLSLEALVGQEDAPWHDVRLEWSDATRAGLMAIEIDGKPMARVVAQRPAQFGLNYLRIEFRSISDDGRIFIAGLASHRNPRE